jgi:hypothetical protein
MGSQPKKPIECKPNDSPRYYGSATEEVLKKLEPIQKRGIRLALSGFAVSRTENVLCKTGMTTLTEMRKLSNTKATKRVVTNK